VAGKVKAIEDFDEKIVGAILKGLEGRKDYRILVLPDHPTPLDVRTHVDEPVPFLIYQPEAGPEKNPELKISPVGYDEEQARATGLHIEEAWRLMEILITGNWPVTS